ncbi:MAG: hypothetical protein WC661_11735 [Opitutaceae bacterium]|jgi:hypothetical protein
MIPFDNRDLFEPWTDPVSGITSHLLAPRLAPVQQSFYFTSPSLTADGRYLWFYTAHPPAGSAENGRTLAVADLVAGTVTACPETQFRDASPFVDGADGTVYWCSNYSVYSRAPSPGARPVLVNRVPAGIHRNRYGKRLATHLTRSADGREFFIDAHFGDEWCSGSLPLDGGDFKVWQTFDRCYNHAQFSPVDPDLVLLAQDWWTDVATGKRHDYDNRIWLIGRDRPARPLFAHSPSVAHEWWDAGGRFIWYVDYARGTCKVDIVTGEAAVVWPAGTCHSHSSRCGRHLVGDIGTYSWNRTGCRVAFFDTVTGREVAIVTALPEPAVERGWYHLDPHPQFCADDSVIVYTTTVRGRIDVALVKTDDLRAATA